MTTTFSNHAFVPRPASAALPPKRPRHDFLPQPDEPTPAPPAELEEPSDLEELDVPYTDDAHWDVFIADDDQRDPLPDPGDFWIEDPDELNADDQQPEFCAYQ